jgi:hypothetical protein
MVEGDFIKKRRDDVKSRKREYQSREEKKN